MQQLLSAGQIRLVCDPASIPSPEAPIEHKVLIGQERAIKALKLGLGMKAHGFNIYVSGPPGTGKLTAITSFVTSQATAEPAPPDWCYVNNFKDTYHPQKLSLPAGTAAQFKKEMKALVHDMYQSLMKAFDSDEYAGRKQKLVNIFEEKQAHLLAKISEEAEKESFAIKQTPNSIVTMPTRDGKPLTEDELKKMSQAEIDEINKRQSKLQEDIGAALREIRKHEKTTGEQLDVLAREVAGSAIGSLIDELIEKHKDVATLVKYLEDVRSDILENLPEFLKSQKPNGAPATENPFPKRYEVTILVDNSETRGAPVITERNPTYNNLLGRVEKESYMGTLVTDFTMIRKGALHSANGGYLILRIEELLQNYFAWDCLKRAIKNREIVIEEATDQLGYLTTRSLKPEPIPLNVKVILIGNSHLYQLLYELDSEFKELFKVKADFDSNMARTLEHIADYSLFIRSLCEKEKLLTPAQTAIGKTVEYSSRLAEDQDKLSTSFGKLSDLVREAAFYATGEGAREITDTHVMRAIEEKIYRSNLIQEKLNEMITTGQVFIDIEDSKVGQVNGLSVLGLGDISFGIPSRITCTVSLGKSGVIAVEREAELSGPLHTKGVLILTGYLNGKFMQERPIGLSARLVFEQSYSPVDGDSASSTELYAILSALSSVPIKQGIAVTGSVNQRGEIQPIGGVNQKVEGYFEICKRKGLNGQQGVMVPAANIKNMMLKEEVVEAVRAGNFKIWAVETIEDGIEILTGMKAGTIKEDGTIFGLVNRALETYAGRMKQFMVTENEAIKMNGESH